MKVQNYIYDTLGSVDGDRYKELENKRLSFSSMTPEEESEFNQLLIKLDLYPPEYFIPTVTSTPIVLDINPAIYEKIKSKMKKDE
jgi:hypothetical protein